MSEKKAFVPQETHLIDRRLFLKISAAISTLFLGRNLISSPWKKINGLATSVQIGDLKNTSELELLKIEKLNLILELLKQKYGVEIYNGETTLVRYFLNGYQRIEDIGLHEKLSIQELELELEHIITEIVKYPTNFFRKNKIKRIRILKDLARIRHPISPDHGSAGQAFHPNEFAITSFQSKAVKSISNDFQIMWKEIIFHHELFHNIQYRIKSFLSMKKYYDLYSSDINDMAITEEYNPYFLEDMSNLAGLLMSFESHKEFLQRILEAQDSEEKSKLQAKYDLIKEIYYDLSDGLMDEEYWADLLAGQITLYKGGENIDQYWIDKTKKQVEAMKQKLH